jgi:hypothetical protein
MNTIEPLYTVGLTKLIFISNFLYKIIRTQLQEYLFTNFYTL